MGSLVDPRVVVGSLVDQQPDSLQTCWTCDVGRFTGLSPLFSGSGGYFTLWLYHSGNILPLVTLLHIPLLLSAVHIILSQWVTLPSGLSSSALDGFIM